MSGPEFENFVLERLGGAQSVGLLALTGFLVAVGVARVDVMRVDQQRAELGAAPFVAPGSERAERVAVIALAAGDDVSPLWLSDLDEILPRHLERRLHRFGSAGHEIGVAYALWRTGDELVGQCLGRFIGEEAGMGVGELVGLCVQRGSHVGMAVAEAGNRRAA